MRPSSPIGSTALLEDRDHGPSSGRGRRLIDVRDQLARGPRAVAEPKSLDIAGSLSGERIFITGATGFLGKVLVEKLLWSVPEVGKLLLLVRPDGERDASERLREEVLGSPIMARLRALYADDWQTFAASGLEVVSGDLKQDRFGLDHEAYEALCRGVDQVVASAATVTFDERLDSAVELNARGARRTLALARDAGNVPLLHVSTCYVSGRQQGWIPERVAAPGKFDVDTTLAALDEACRRARDESDADASLVAAGAEKARRHGFRDVYTLTKALGERLLAREQGAVPIAEIIRPAIIESAVAQPIPGWIDAVRVADPLLVAYGRGRARELPGVADAPLELIPVDYVVNVMLAALADLHRAEAPEQAGDQAGEEQIRVYQVGSSRNPISLGDLMAYAREGFAGTPLRDENGRPIEVGEARFVEPGRFHRKLAARRRRLRRLSRWLPRRRTRGAERFDHFMRLVEVYRPYLTHGARYEDKATRGLWNRLSVEERAVFPFDVLALDWHAYITGVHVPGVVRFALRAESGAPEPPRPMAARRRPANAPRG